MGWDAVVFGELAVPTSTVEAWLTGEVAPSDFKGWPDFFDDSGEPRTPEVLLEELKAFVLEPHEHLDVQHDGGKVSVSAMMAKDPMLDTRMALATLWRSAAKHGGKGTLTFLGYQTAAFGYRVTVVKGKSSVKVLTGREQAAIEKGKPFKAVDARAHAALDGLLGKKPGKKAKGVNPFTGKKAG